MASGTFTWGQASPAAPRKSTPEVYLAKQIDNSRLRRVTDVERAREMFAFSLVLAVLFGLIGLYAWQHFSSIEYGYRIEAQKMQRDNLLEMNRALRLEEASLRDPGRIDVLARRMGFEAPQPGQVMRMETTNEPGVPVLAREFGIQVIAAAQ